MPGSTNVNSCAIIEFRGVGYSFGTQPVLRDINFDVNKGETLVLLGRSGSGKTTALKLINRLLIPSYGEVVVHERDTVAWDPIKLRRSIGWVIQESGLFPHYSVEKNIAVVPALEGWAADRTRERVSELMRLVGLDASLSARYPHELSGGQRQRVGVARALAANPHILLMDEPFGALDPITRSELQKQFVGLQQRLRKTIVIVTHDVREAILLGTRIALLENGSLFALSTTEEFLKSTATEITQYTDSIRALPV